MFRPSQTLLFRPMPTLNKFKIHPPLPLNARESKQLLSLLTNSFRQQLDAEHGEFRTSPAVRSSEIHRSRETYKQRRRSESDFRPTDKHMHSILTNPLFKLGPDGKTTKSERDPMEVFDLAVAKGLMNLHYARACLNAKKREIIQSSVPTVREGLKESGAGLKVLKWLISSGMANNNEFLNDVPFAQVLMEYLVAEGLQEVCWKWIKRGFEAIPRYLSIADPIRHKETRRAIVGPLYLLVRAEASGDVSLDAAYLCMSRAVNYMTGCPVGRMRDLLNPPGWFLMNETTALYSERPPSSLSAFESFFSLIPVLSKYSAYQLAHLSLLHPSEPKADLALGFLRNVSPSSSVRHTKDYSCINLGLETAKFLLEREQHEDAEWVMNFLRERYSHQLGIKQIGQLEQAKAEASSLQLLESLSLV